MKKILTLLAAKCGFTPQYEGRGLVIVGFPCDQFGHQEPGSDEEIVGFGDSDTGKFMDGMLSRTDPDYASNPDIKWNFTKFLIDRKGRVVARFEPVITPEQLAPEIEALL